MPRKILVSPSPEGSLLLFAADMGSLPDEVVLYEHDPRGFVAGATDIEDFDQAVMAMNQSTQLQGLFLEGDELEYMPDNSKKAVYRNGIFARL